MHTENFNYIFEEKKVQRISEVYHTYERNPPDNKTDRKQLRKNGFYI